MRPFLLLIILLLLGCHKTKLSSDSIDLRKTSIVEDTIVVKKLLFADDEFSYSNYSFIQSNNSGLYITPPTNFRGAVLYRYELKPKSDTAIVSEIIKTGRGPYEMESIYMSSKTIDGDTLLFSSPNNNTFIIDQEGSLNEWEFNTKKIINYSFSFSYSHGRLLIPSFSGHQSDFLFKIYRFKGGLVDSVYNSFPPRVPYGFQPSIRNEILGETPIPYGFAISFLGDKKVYILSPEGKTRKEIVLGKSDEIPTPYKVNNPQHSPGAKPYITKLEFYNGHLMALMDNIIWIIEYPSFELKTKIKLLTDENPNNSPVIDFSISDDYLYSRIGREGIYFTKTNFEWFH